VSYDKIGFTETAFRADFDFLNYVGSPKVKYEARVAADAVGDRIIGLWCRTGGGVMNLIRSPAARDGQC